MRSSTKTWIYDRRLNRNFNPPRFGNDLQKLMTTIATVLEEHVLGSIVTQSGFRFQAASDDNSEDDDIPLPALPDPPENGESEEEDTPPSEILIDIMEN